MYLTIINETLQFIEREMTHEKGGFYSALDADSEGIERKFYVWKKEEFPMICGPYADLMSDYYGVDEDALWKDDNNILLIKESKDEFSQRNNLSTTELNSLLKYVKGKLLKTRESRVRPGSHLRLNRVVKILILITSIE